MQKHMQSGASKMKKTTRLMRIQFRKAIKMNPEMIQGRKKK